MANRSALLVIADIGGYTAFVRNHRASLAHAQDIVARLLEALIDAAPELTLIEIEGDAAFFYAWPPGGREEDAARLMADCSLAMHRAFRAVQQHIETLNICRCQGCRDARDLKVKFVAHFGEVVMQRVKQISKVAGLEVILVHRMLKNAVPVPEYMLLSEPLYRLSDPNLRVHSVPLAQEFEGLGQVQTYFIDIDGVALAPPAPPRRTLLGMLAENIGVLVRAFPYRFGFRKPRFALSARRRN
ncbi:MAG TPA: DUF2652 domain-containing protein [Burkholderiales bacterium]|nr:DUF2652 domain-containing protein [Burkholderiales bacterium]